MSQPTKPAKNLHPWSPDALLAKAQRYIEEMLKHPRDDWRFALWSTFALEQLGRAALAKMSPALLADQRDRNNLYYALGRDPTATKFIPRSIDTKTVFASLRELVREFTPELEGFAALHMARRNEEVHGGSAPFDGLRPLWLATYYETCSVLLSALDESLPLLLGPGEAKVAKKMIAASKDKSARAVMKTIAAHKTIWEGKRGAEQAKLVRQASAWATRQAGHRVTCPACGSDALLTGQPVSAPLKTLEGDLIVETLQYLPSKFECVACRLKISGLSQLSASGLGTPYKKTFTFDAATYYAPADDFVGFDDDNNEY